MVNPLDLLATSMPSSPVGSDSTQNHRTNRRSSIRETLKVIAQILVPLMIGTFTVVIALQQHNTAKENRKKDLEIAAQLREQQYQLDEQRRSQEFQLEEARRTQDIEIALNKQRDSVFDSYIRDLSHLLLISNYQLTRSMLNSIVRPMTLTILRQIDPPRKVLLLKFLYESKMIRRDEKSSLLDLSDGDFNGIRLEKLSMTNISLVGTSLTNSSFVLVDFSGGDFERTDLTDSKFLSVRLFSTNFYCSRLVRVKFDQSELDLADLSLADLTDSNLNKFQFDRVLMSNMATLPNGTESENSSLFDPPSHCNMYRWKIRPSNGLFISDSCDFHSLIDELQITFRIGLQFYRHLIEDEKALFQFSFQTNQTDENQLRVEFIYSDIEPGENVTEKGLFSSSFSFSSKFFYF